MNRILLGGIVTSCVLAMVALVGADDARDEAIKKDRKLYEGTWKVVSLEVNGNKSSDEDAKKMSVVNGIDGSWSLRLEGQEQIAGVNELDPTKSPKTIDVIVVEGGQKKMTYQGIYEITETKRKLCIVPPGIERPNDFTSAPGSERILVSFEKEVKK